MTLGGSQRDFGAAAGRTIADDAARLHTLAVRQQQNDKQAHACTHAGDRHVFSEKLAHTALLLSCSILGREIQ
jgi:hypothetical protein